MSGHYMKEILRIAVAQICQTIGYNATQTAPLELLQDVLDKFLREFTRDLRRHVEHYNRTEANLDDVTLTLNSINVNLNELLDYINNVEPVPFISEVPKFPARKDSSLNFLKPGSKEVLTRRVHVHDHLPPMLPPEITQPSEPSLSATSNSLSDTKSFNDNIISNNTDGEQNNVGANKSLNASNVLDKNTLQSLFKPTSIFEDGERPTREVSSVVMTTGGYISPAVEGKMPEAIVPDIIDKLLGLDAPPPPPPPPPPPQPSPLSRSAVSSPVPPVSITSNPTVEKDLTDVRPSTSKESRKALSRNLEPQPITNKKMELLNDLPIKKDKIFNSSSGKTNSHDVHPTLTGNFNKKSFMMHQNTAGMHTPQTNYANMLLKKAKKQKVPSIPGQPLNEKHGKPMADKIGKLDAADKAHRKYMKMLQKMAKQGKIPPELLSSIMGNDKKSKMINPAIVASMPPGPEKLQLEKLMRKQTKQRQKIMKQQMMLEVQKQSKKPIQPPPLVPIFPSARMPETANKILHVDLEEQKLKTEQKDLAKNSPEKSALTTNIATPPQATSITPTHLSESGLSKNVKTSNIGENPPEETMETPLNSSDGKELKLSNEPDRSKLNIFKKISKQKTPKSASPTPMRIAGLNDTPIINLPSGTTITPAPVPSTTSNSSLTTTHMGRNLFPPLSVDTLIGSASGVNSNVVNVDGIKEKPVGTSVNPNQPTDLTMLNRVFGEKPDEVMEIVNKPKKRGRKPGSKNSPKIPGVFPNTLLRRNNKKAILNNSNLFASNMSEQPQENRSGKKASMINSSLFSPNIPQLPQDFRGGLGKKTNLNNTNLFGPNFYQLPQEIRSGMGNLPLDNVSQFFTNPINSTEWSQNKQLQQQVMIMAGAKERKEYKKKNKLLKQELLNNDNKMSNMNAVNPRLAVPTSEEVQSINKKLMRMDTILKATPSAQSTDLTVDTNLITDKKLPSPSVFPTTTSPLKSPGNSKRLMMGTENISSNLVQPFMLPNRPVFPNLPSNMLSMLQFPFPTRPGLIPTPGLFPTPGLGAFPNNSKNPLLSGIFPFPNLKQSTKDIVGNNQESEDLTTDKKKLDMNLQSTERSYCNVAPLVPDFLTTKLNDNNTNGSNKHHEPSNSNEPDLPKTPKPRNSHQNTSSQDILLKKMGDVHTPDSVAGSKGSKSIPSTPGGISLNTFEQLMKKNDSPIDLVPLNKHSKSLSSCQESGLDFSMSKKQSHPTVTGELSIKPPITLNNEPIEVSDDSDEANQSPIKIHPPSHASTSIVNQSSSQQQHNNFNMDDIFVGNTATHMLQKPIESDLTMKELRKLKKQVKKSASSVNNSTDNSDGLGGGPAGGSGVGKLAGGADLIPLASTGLAYSAKNIPYNSLTANANPTFNVHKSDFNTSAPSSSATTSSSVFDDLTITTAIPSSSGNVSATIFDIQKKRKEHKKLKKLKELKEGKIKKKKDKKDKNKSKEKAEKYLVDETPSSSNKEKEHLTIKEPVNSAPTPVMSHSSGLEKIKDKDLLKKLKKEKKKEKQRSVLEELPSQNTSIVQMSTSSTKEKELSAITSTSTLISHESEPKRQKLSPGTINSVSSGNNQETSPSSNSNIIANQSSLVPKLTLKLGSTHSPTPPRDDGHKNSVTAAVTVSASSAAASVTSAPLQEHQREPSPELARISPLVTRPPKHKPSASVELTSGSSAASNTISAANVNSLDIGDNSKSGSASNSNMIVPPPSPWLSGGTISASSVLLPHQLLQTTKHDMTTTPNATHSTDTSTKTSNTDRQSPLTLITETSRPSSYIDAEGNRVWICPACGKVDDGSPMIGCDGCDAWYHWVCVGIFVAPKDNEDWFCRVCITRRKGLHGSDKKRKRNKKK